MKSISEHTSCLVIHKLTSMLQAAEAKQELQDIVNFLRDPEKYTSLGAKLPKGRPMFSGVDECCHV